MEQELIPMEKLREIAQGSKHNIAHEEIEASYKEARKELMSNEDFQKVTHEIVQRGAQAELDQHMISILSAEQKNELSKYALECEKQKLAYKKKKEKGVIAEEVKAEVANKKIEALKKRYGYLYEKDNNGEPIGFIANKTVNKYKEFCNWYDGTSNGFKKVVKATLKVLLWGGVAVLVCLLGYRAIKWIADNTQNLPNL